MATLKPHRDRGGVGSEYFDARLALASRHLRVLGFSSRGNKKKHDKGTASFSATSNVLEPQSAGHLKLLPVEWSKMHFFRASRGEFRIWHLGNPWCACTWVVFIRVLYKKTVYPVIRKSRFSRYQNPPKDFSS